MEKITNNTTKDSNLITINSLNEFISAINDLTKDCRLYKEVIEHFIEKIKNKEESKEKDWEYYSSTFLIQESNAIYYALSKLLGDIGLDKKNELINL